MARRRGAPEVLNAWPGYVDALSTLLMVIIFVLLVFILAQAFQSVSLSGREQDLQRVTRQVGQISDLLAVERSHSAELQAAQVRLDQQLQAAGTDRDNLAATLQAARDAEARALADRDAVRAARDTLASQVGQAQAQVDAARARDALLAAQLAGAGVKVDQTTQQAAATATQLAAMRRQLDEMVKQKAELDQTVTADRATIQARLSDLAAASTALSDTRKLFEEMQKQRDALNATVQVDRATMAAQLSDVAKLSLQVTDLAALRDKLTRQAQDATVRATTEAQRRRAVEVTLATATTDLAKTERLLAEMQRQRDALDKTVQADRATMAIKLSELAKLTQQNTAETTRRQAVDASLTVAKAELAQTQRQLADIQKQRDALDTTEKTDRATLTAKLSELARLNQQLADATARAKAEADQRGAVDTQLASAKGEDADLRAKLGTIEQALKLSEGSAQSKDVQITDLNGKLNSALAQKVEELQGYRSEFFGRMREVLANRPGISVVGDRFVFQSEVLFPSGSADLTSAGQDQMAALASTLNELAKSIPADVPWVLRVDGHADRQAVDRNGPFTDNLDLSAKRAINVVKLLADDGVPANRLAAVAFGDTQPLDPAATPEAYAKNRRIEIRLTDR